MTNTKSNSKFHIPSKDIDNSATDVVSHIDPVPPREQVEEQDRYFNQMGDTENAKFAEQRKDDNEALGSTHGEYENDDENTDEHPPKEEVLHDDQASDH